MFLGSDNGGKAATILYSVMASAKANQVEPFAYVCDLLGRFSSNRPADLSELLPDVWRKSHPDAQRPADCYNIRDFPARVLVATFHR